MKQTGDSGHSETQELSEAKDRRARTFMCACLKSRWDPGGLSTGRALVGKPGFDWNAVWPAAVREGVVALLYGTVRGHSLVPPELEQRLKGRYLQNVVRNMHLYSELTTVLKRLRASGVPVLVLKGAALAEVVYRNIGLRSMTDVDLLVRQEDVERVTHMLADLGYRSDLVETIPGSQVDEHHAEGLIKRGRHDVVMGIHWRLFDSPFYRHRLEMDWFWESAVAVEIDEEPALILGPEAQILHLCGHLVLHHGRGDEWRLIWLHDIGEVLAFYRDQIDWEELLARAMSCELEVPVRLVLNRLAAEWGVPVPGEVLAQLDGLQASPKQVRLYARRTAENAGVAQRFWADLASIPGWRTQARYAFTQVFPSRAYMEHRYRIPHAVLVPLYYPYRLLVGMHSALKRPRG